MSDPTDPLLSDVAKAAGGAGTAGLGAFFLWLRGESSRSEERREILSKLAAIETAVIKSDRELALLTQSLTERSARFDHLEKRLDDLDDAVSELQRNQAYQSGIRKADK